MSYLSLLQKFNKTNLCPSRAANPSSLFASHGMGNFFHLSMSVCAIRASFVAAGFEDNRSPNVITGGVLCHWGCYRDHVALVPPRVSRRTKAKFHGAAFRATTSRRREKKKENGRGRGKALPPTSQKESLEIPRHMLHGTSRLLTWPHSRNICHPLARLTLSPSSLHAAAVEKFKFTHRLPRVCFSNLWKMSLAGRGPLLLLLFLFSSRGLPPLSLLFRLELGFPKPFLSYPIAAEAPKFIAGRVEELKRLRTIRTDTKLNFLICVAFNSYLFGVLVVNCILKYQFDKLSILLILQAAVLLILLQHFHCFNGKKEKIMRCAQ